MVGPADAQTPTASPSLGEDRAADAGALTLQASPADILRQARALIAGKGWTQGCYARTAFGTDLEQTAYDPWDDEAAACFCASGAVIAAMRSYDYYGAHPVWDVFQRLLPDHLPAWNDAPGRTKDDVLAAFDQAIALAASIGDAGRAEPEAAPSSAQRSDPDPSTSGDQ